MVDVARGINRAMRVHGFLAVNKPKGLSSASVLRFLKQLYYPSMNKNHRKSFSEYFSVENERVLERVKAGENVRKLPWKVGHGGTLDPEASGVLLITLGNGCKSQKYFENFHKAYIGRAILGYATDTLDMDGTIVKKAPRLEDTKNKILSVIPRFIGQINQVPPLYSAVKLLGKPLYSYARKGIPVDSTAKLRKTTINSINLDWYYDSITEKLREQPSDKGQLAYQGTNRIEIGDPATKLLSTDEGKGYFQVSVKCSRGTYIRTLIDDMCKEIGSCGVTSDIIRTEEGPFKLGVNTIELSELENVEGVLAAVSECCKLLNYNGNPDGAITLSV